MSWLSKGTNSQIQQCTCPISHNAPFRTEMYTLWDLGQVYCEICEIGQLRFTYDSYDTMVIVESSRWLLMAWCLFGHHDQQPSSARARVDWCIPGSSQCYGIHCAVFVQFWNANVVMVTTTVASLAARMDVVVTTSLWIIYAANESVTEKLSWFMYFNG